jgi:hypothetical protein
VESALNRNSLLNAVWAGGAELIEDKAVLRQVKTPKLNNLKPVSGKLSGAAPGVVSGSANADNKEQK